jgi:hypothetical protein
MRLCATSVLLFLGTVLLPSSRVDAATITLISSGGGVYNYGLTLNPFESLSFDAEDRITLSGLSGITSTDAEYNLDTCGFTETTACFDPSVSGLGNFSSSPFIFSLLRVTRPC